MLNSEMLLREVPVINRARGYRLYSKSGRRILDMYQNGGKAILGHRPNRLGLTVKNSLEKGLYAELPSIYEDRLLRQLEKRFDGYIPGIFRSWCEMEAWVKIHAPEASRAVWRPFLPEGTEWGNASVEKKGRTVSGSLPDILMPVLPMPGMIEYAIVLIQAKSNIPKPPVALCSPVLVSGILKCLHELTRAEKLNPYSGVAAGGDVSKPLDFVLDLPMWGFIGPYGAFRGKSDYNDFFRHYLGNDILIPPDPKLPLILPAEWSKGEVKKFVNTSKILAEEGIWTAQ